MRLIVAAAAALAYVVLRLSCTVRAGSARRRGEVEQAQRLQTSGFRMSRVVAGICLVGFLVAGIMSLRR